MRRKLAAAALISVLAAAAIPLASPAGATGAFVDDDGNIHEPAIERMAALGVTRGCNPPSNTKFCPDDSVSRGQMAAFMVRTFGLEATGASFTDTAGSVFVTDIDKLATAEITKGCNPPANTRFCPDDAVTRGQMAAFLVRALGLSDLSASDFADTDSHVFETDISRLAAAGITRGCNPPTNTRFCPDALVRRDQMATFLSRAYDIATTGSTTSSLPPGSSSSSSSSPTSTSTTAGGVTTSSTSTTSTSTSTTSTTTSTTIPRPPAGWATRSPLADDLTDAAGAAHDGILYLAGGKRSATNRVLDFLAYDPIDNSWQELDDMPGVGREDVGLVAVGSHLYAFGGASSDPFIGNITTAARYSPANGTWSTSAVENLPAGRSGMAAVLYGGDIWLIGGFAAAGDSLDTVLIYDTATETYSNGPELPEPRDHAGAVVVNGELLVFGGRTLNGGVSEPTSVIRLTSPDDNTWSEYGDPMPRKRRSFVIGVSEGKIQLFGGESQDRVAIDDVDEFDPVMGDWNTSLPDLPTPRHGPAGATIGASTYVVGGSKTLGSSSLTDVNERFTR